MLLDQNESSLCENEKLNRKKISGWINEDL